MSDKFTIMVLLYGDHVDLAARCLNSICRAAHKILPGALRIGMNAPSTSTSMFVESLVKHGWVLPHNVYKSSENLHKYPMMRWMLYDDHNPIETPYVMWFDDDSFIQDKMIGATPSFLESLITLMECPDREDHRLPTLCGGVYTIRVVPNQCDWIEDQPWHTGKPVSSTMRFVTGGWWVARFEALKQFGYPFPELDHRGGDVMLGALCEQQGLRIRNYRHGVAINADGDGRESRATRRGFDQRPCGYDYRRDLRSVQKAIIETPETLGPIQEALARAKLAKEISGPPVVIQEDVLEDRNENCDGEEAVTKLTMGPARAGAPPVSASPRRYLFLDL